PWLQQETRRYAAWQARGRTSSGHQRGRRWENEPLRIAQRRLSTVPQGRSWRRTGRSSVYGAAVVAGISISTKKNQTIISDQYCAWLVLQVLPCEIDSLRGDPLRFKRGRNRSLFDNTPGNTCARLHRIWKVPRVARILGLQITPASVSEELPSEVRRPIGSCRNGGVFRPFALRIRMPQSVTMSMRRSGARVRRLTFMAAERLNRRFFEKWRTG